MTTAWTCLEPGCDEHGDTDRGAERHTKAGHATVCGTTTTAQMPGFGPETGRRATQRVGSVLGDTRKAERRTAAKEATR